MRGKSVTDVLAAIPSTSKFRPGRRAFFQQFDDQDHDIVWNGSITGRFSHTQPPWLEFHQQVNTTHAQVCTGDDCPVCGFEGNL